MYRLMLQRSQHLTNAPIANRSLRVCAATPLAPSLERQRLRLCLLQMVLDGIVIFVGFLAAGALYLGEFPADMAIRKAALIAPFFLLLGAQSGFYRSELLFSSRRTLFMTCYVFTVSLLLFLFITFYSKSAYEFSRVVLTLGSVVSVALILALRWAIRQWLRRAIGPSLQNTLIIQAGGPEVHMDHAFLIEACEHGLSPDASDPVNLDRLGRYMENMDRVIISCRQQDRDQWSPLLKAAGVQGEFVSDALRRLGALKLQNESGFSSVVVSARPLDLGARMVKRLMDVSLSTVGLIALSPVVAVVALLIKLEDGGPILFKQRRMGTGNRFFWIYKFRSMRVEATDAEAGRLTSRDDDRTTRIGKFIRRTSIDELPQLFNVWRGDMSLVGPRPHALGALAGERLYWEVDGRYWNRHVLKPGVTGLAQVRGYRGNTEDEQSLTNRLQADLEYISSWSVWLDIRIIVKTFQVLIHQNAY